MLNRSVLCLLFSVLCGSASAQNQTINGNLTVTGSIEADGQIDTAASTLTFGTQGSSFGGALLHQDSNIDTFTFLSNRNPASWLWQHTVGIAAMRLDANHQLILYQADGTTAGVTLMPASNAIKLGAHANGTLTADANGVITAGGGFTVAGNFANTSGTLTGGASGLNLSAGGTDQSITLSSSAAGDIIFNTNGLERARIKSTGNVGIGTVSPGSLLSVRASTVVSTGGSVAIKQSTSSDGFVTQAASSDAYTQVYHDGNIAVVRSDYQSTAGYKPLTFWTSNVEKVRIDTSGNVGIGTTNPQNKLSIDAAGAFGFYRAESGADMVGLDYLNVDGGAGDIMRFRANVGTTNFNRTNMVIARTTGNVGIGTTTPGAKLHIAGGNARFSAIPEAWSEGVRIDVARNSWGGVRWYRGDANYNGNWGLGYKNDSSDDLVFINNHSGTQYDRLTLTKTGNVGIGTSAPQGKLHIAGAFSGGILEDTNDRPSVGLSGHYPQAVLMAGGSGHTGHGPTVMLGSYDAGIAGAHKHWSIGTSGVNSTFLDIGYHAGIDHNPHAGIRNYNGSTILTLLNTGNVGIGTTTPGARLTAVGSSGSNPTTASFGAGYTIAGHYQRAVGNNAPVLVTGVTNANNDGYAGLLMLGSSYTTEATGQTVGGLEFLQPTSGKVDGNAGSKAAIYGVTAGGGGTTGGYGGQLQFATRPDNSTTSPWSAIRMTIDQTGNVGIGTTAPISRLNVVDAIPGVFLGTGGVSTVGGIQFNGNNAVLLRGNVYRNNSGTDVIGDTSRWQWDALFDVTGNAFQIRNSPPGSAVAFTTRFFIAGDSGNIGIGTSTPGGFKLAVRGKIRAEEIVVDTGWADYVFEEDYRLAPLAEVESHIREKKHLPGIPSAAEVAEHGVSMGEMQSKLLSKVEELTLHLIAQEKRLSAQDARLAQLESENRDLRAALTQP